MSFRKILIFVGLTMISSFLGGCGFEPLYAPSSQKEVIATPQGELASIRINLIADRRGQLLRNHLISLLTPFGQPKKPLYNLEVTLKENSQALGILKDATFSKSQMTYTATFILKDAATHKILFEGVNWVVADYNVITNSEFATVVSAQNAQNRSMLQLAHQISRTLATFFHKEEPSSS